MSATAIIIEGDASVAEAVAEACSAHGVVTRIEADVSAGLGARQQTGARMLFVSADTADLSGNLETLKQLCTEEPGDTYVLVQGDEDEGGRALADELNAKRINKPIVRAELYALLRDALGRRLAPDRGISLVKRRGDLAEVPFARLFGLIFSNRTNGALLLRKSSVKKIVYFSEGLPVQVKSNLLSECLGQIMVSERLISSEECAESLERKKREGHHQGEILVHMGSISRRNLQFALELQLQLKLYDLFSWLEGQYQLNEDAVFRGAEVRMSTPPAAFVHEGARRAMSHQRIRRELRLYGQRRAMASADPTLRYQTLELDPRADDLIDMLDGTRTVDELVQAAGFEAEAAARVIYALATTSLIKFDDRGHEEFEEVSLGDQDVEVLSTGEINLIAELAKVDTGEEAISALPAEEQDVPGAEPVLAVAPRRRFSSVNTMVEDPLDSESASMPPELEDVFADPSTPPEGSLLVGESVSVLDEPPPSSPSRPDSPALSDDVRKQVRARLEAEAARLTAAHHPDRTDRTGVAASPRKGLLRPATPELEAEQAEHLSTLRQRYEELAGQSYYELLGLEPEASVEDVRAAYHARARELHPDQVLPADLASWELRLLAERTYLLLTRALDTLSDPVARVAYDQRQQLHEEQEPEAALFAADAAFDKGRAAIQTGRWDEARVAFHRATELAGDEGIYWAYLGWSVCAPDPSEANQTEAMGYLDRAVELSPAEPDVFSLRGRVHRAAGRNDRAFADFERALSLDPDDTSAQEELKTLEPPASPKRGGLLSRLNIGS